MRLGLICSFLFCLLVTNQSSIAQELKWESLEPPSDASLRGLSVASDRIIWASGSGGTWLRTVDGGVTWDTGIIAGLDNVDFRSIHAFDANNAVVASAGQPSQIYRTSNGGKSWELIETLSEEAFLDGMGFYKKVGLVFGDPVAGEWMVLKSEDEGITWEVLGNLPIPKEGEAGFAASTSSIALRKNMVVIGSGGAESNLIISLDQGDSWTKIKSPLVQGEPSQGIFALSFWEDKRVVLVGGDYLKPTDKKGTVGVFDLKSMKWMDIESTLPGYRSGVEFWATEKVLIAVGTTGSDFSKDGGLSWESISEEGYHAVKTDPKGKVILASGGNGKIAKLTFQ